MASTVTIRLPRLPSLLPGSRPLRIVGIIVSLALALALVSLGGRSASAAEAPVTLGTDPAPSRCSGAPP